MEKTIFLVIALAACICGIFLQKKQDGKINKFLLVTAVLAAICLIMQIIGGILWGQLSSNAC